MIRWLYEQVVRVPSLKPPDTLAEWFTTVAVVVGAPWALITFRRNNRIKAAELMLKLEDECKQCLETLLKIEYLPDYKATFKAALAAAGPTGRGRVTATQSTAINNVEKVLRHFHACYHIRRLGVDAGALDRAYSYYLSMCISDDRAELRSYIKYFWPNVFFWAERVGHPWPKRAYIRARQTWPRIRVWWRGSPGEI